MGKKFIVLNFLIFGCILQMEAYTPACLNGKYQFGLIDWNFYYHGDQGGEQWMPKLVSYYTQGGILGLRRSIIPGAMVDPNGDLYTVTLERFNSNGPSFQLTKLYYANGGVSQKNTIYSPWTWIHNNDNLNLDKSPCFDNDSNDKNRFKSRFHHCLTPIILQEPNFSSDEVRVFHWCPPRRIYRYSYSGIISFEGPLRARFRKSDLAKVHDAKNDASSTEQWKWSCGLRNYSEENNKPFPHNIGAFQGFHLELRLPENPGTYSYDWIFHLWQPSDGNDNGRIHCDRYTNDFSKAGAVQVDSGKINSSVAISPRFISIGNYVYFVYVEDGYWFRLARITPNLSNSDSVGTVENRVCKCRPDSAIETSGTNTSITPYPFDFCLLEPDGTPSTSSSPNGDKILCLFGFYGGTGDNDTNSQNYKWTTTYVNWRSYGGSESTNAAGVLASFYMGTGGNVAVSYGQDAIYVTDYARRAGNYVNLDNTSKADIYRLYLNSHKIVPYTSPSGKHYIIYAYCYPGKKTHLYLGYAQYYVTANHQVRLLSKTEFKASGNNGWGDSFGDFTDCTRIISMDLKNGHLWITFMKDSDIDVAGLSLAERKAGAHYNAFHILAKDLIQE